SSATFLDDGILLSGDKQRSYLNLLAGIGLRHSLDQCICKAMNFEIFFRKEWANYKCGRIIERDKLKKLGAAMSKANSGNKTLLNRREALLLSATAGVGLITSKSA